MGVERGGDGGRKEREEELERMSLRMICACGLMGLGVCACAYEAHVSHAVYLMI